MRDGEDVQEPLSLTVEFLLDLLTVRSASTTRTILHSFSFHNITASLCKTSSEEWDDWEQAVACSKTYIVLEDRI